MIKNLVVNGCSWTAGDELQDDPAFDDLLKARHLARQYVNGNATWNIVNENGKVVGQIPDWYNMLNWAGVLKEHIKADNLTNLAMGGGSNSRILRTTVDYIMSLSAEKRKETLVVIGWTISDRDEICLNNTYQRWNAAQPFAKTVERKTFSDESLIEKISKIHDDYVLYLHSDYGSVKKYFQQVYLLANLLENLSVNFFFFNALPIWWNGGELAFDVDVVKEFPEQLTWQENNNNMLNHDDSMLNFIESNKLPRAKYFHPLSEGHSQWADYLHVVMRKRGILRN